MSETAKCRARLAPYCWGYGLDLGFGGDPIVPWAICLDLPQPYARVGTAPQHLAGDAGDLSMLADGCLDFVFSSHLLEDFEDTGAVLREWLRVLKPGGRLVVYCPDEPTYRRHCELTGQVHNENHRHADFGLQSVLAALPPGAEVIYSAPHVDDYSFEVVVRRP